MTLRVRRLLWLWPLLVAPGLAGAAAKGPAPCVPCGDWSLQSTDNPDAAVDAALREYKPPRRSRLRFTPGDIASEAAADFENSLSTPPGDYRKELREELVRLTRIPAALKLRQEGEDIVIDQGPNDRRRVTPGEPHSRVDARGTARIAARMDRGALSVSETYDGKTGNSESYRVDPNGLLVTRVIERRGLPKVTLKSRYTAAPQ